MRANPGGEIDPADVLGRDRLIKSVWRVLERQSVELTAERRIGKSSIIKKMTAEPAPGFAAVYQDLEGIRTRLQFVQAVYKQADFFLSVRKKTADRFQRLVSALSGTEFSGVRLPKILAPDWKRVMSALCEDLQDQLEGRLVFFWDEIPFMLQNIRAAEGAAAAREVLDVLRAVRQTNDRIRMVFTGSIGLHHVLGELRSKDVSHAPMNDMDRIDVPTLRQEDAGELARRIIAGEEIPAQNVSDTVAGLAKEVDGVAYYVHLVLDGLIKEGLDATPTTVPDLIRRRIHDPTDPWHLAHFVQRTESYYGPNKKLALSLLDGLAAARALSRQQLINIAQASVPVDDPQDVLDMLAKLSHDHYCVADADGNYRFTYAVAKRWWAHHRVGASGVVQDDYLEIRSEIETGLDS